MRTLAAVGLCLIVARAPGAQSPRREPDFSELRRIIREGMVNEKATAAAVPVVRDGAIVWEEHSASSPAWDVSVVTLR